MQQYNLNTHEKLIYYNMYGELAFFNAQRHGVVAELKQFKALNLKDFADIETSVQDYSLRPLGYWNTIMILILAWLLIFAKIVFNNHFG